MIGIECYGTLRHWIAIAKHQEYLTPKGCSWLCAIFRTNRRSVLPALPIISKIKVARISSYQVCERVASNFEPQQFCVERLSAQSRVVAARWKQAHGFAINATMYGGVARNVSLHTISEKRCAFVRRYPKLLFAVDFVQSLSHMSAASADEQA